MRINVIDPRYLADQHLVAEYRELKMLPKSLLRSLNSKAGFVSKRVPKNYTLNTGHGYFFYDKVGFIVDRFQLILKEMEYRKFTTNFRELPLEGIPEKFFGNYKITEEAIQINLERIRLRIACKPTWFKYFGGPMRQFDWDVLYENYCKDIGIPFETIEECKDNPIPDNKNLKIYPVGSGHY